MSLECLRLILQRGIYEIYGLKICPVFVFFFFFKYIEISFEKYAKIDIDTIAAEIKRYFIFSNNNDLSLFCRYEGCKYPTHFFSFSAVDYLPPTPPLPPCASACQPHIMCIMIVQTYIYAKWLAEAWGESTFKNFSCFHYV